MIPSLSLTHRHCYPSTECSIGHRRRWKRSSVWLCSYFSSIISRICRWDASTTPTIWRRMCWQASLLASVGSDGMWCSADANRMRGRFFSSKYSWGFHCCWSSTTSRHCSGCWMHIRCGICRLFCPQYYCIGKSGAHLSSDARRILIRDFSFSFLIDDTINLRRIKYEQIEFDVEKEKLIWNSIRI